MSHAILVTGAAGGPQATTAITGSGSGHVANTDATQFHIASMDMQFTAAAALRLVDSGSISLNDHVGEFRASREPTRSPFVIFLRSVPGCRISRHCLATMMSCNIIGRPPA